MFDPPLLCLVSFLPLSAWSEILVTAGGEPPLEQVGSVVPSEVRSLVYTTGAISPLEMTQTLELVGSCRVMMLPCGVGEGDRWGFLLLLDT